MLLTLSSLSAGNQSITLFWVLRGCCDHVLRSPTRPTRVSVQRAYFFFLMVYALLTHYSDLIENLFNSYLFPDLSDPSETEVITPHVPVMHEETREELYNILVLLAKHADNYGKIMDLMIDLIPSGTTVLHTQMKLR